MKKWLLYLALAVCFLAVIFFQPWQRRSRVLTILIPNARATIELWEKPYFDIPILAVEYTTWLRVLSANGQDNWHVMDEQYITFRVISVFLSTDDRRVRIETNGEMGESHMIAEYDLVAETFVSKSEPSVRNKGGWTLMIERKIR